MSPEAVHAILADLPNRAVRVATRADGREAWRFSVDANGPTYELHFYPDDDTLVRRRIGGAAAAREFAQLQALQKHAIPATRVIANLKGLRLGERKGDACIVLHDADAVPLDAATAALRGRGDHAARLKLLAELIERLEALHRRKTCPRPLIAHGFARRQRDGAVMLADGSGPLAGIVDAERLAELDRSTRQVTTAALRLRAWRHFRDDAPPRNNRALKRLTRAFVGDATRGDGPHFGAIEFDGWLGRFASRVPLTLPWSGVNDIEASRDEWLAALPAVLDDSSRGEAIKDDAAARVSSATLTLAGRAIEVIVKRPRYKPGVRGTYRSYRRSRAMRAWLKTWRLLSLGLPCERPIAVLERRRALRVVEQALIVERVPGSTLAGVDLDALPARERSRLIYAAGRTLRLIERAGYTHDDAKSTNWIAWTDASGRARPVMVDLDGVRLYPWRGLGHERLARAMRLHPQATADDLRELDEGYRGP